MRSILTTAFIILFWQISFSQSGTIRGFISTSNGKPAPYVLIRLDSAGRSCMSNEDGSFELRKADTGYHRLICSSAGLTGTEKTIHVTAGQLSRIDIIMLERDSLLREVIVSSSRSLNQRNVSTSRSLLSNMDLPQTTGLVNHNVISDQQVTRVGEIVRNVSGVTLTQTRLGVNETYTARGYSIGVSGDAGSVLKNGMVSNSAGMPEAATLESVEVMKGSSALQYGNVSGGLILNLITRKPKFEPGAGISMQTGSYHQYKPVIDFYGPLSRKLAYRMIATYENDRSFRDVVKTERKFINPSLLYQFNGTTSLLVQAEYLKADLTPDFGIGALDSGRVIPANIPVSRFLNVSWAYNHVDQRSGYFKFDHHFSDTWQLALAGSLQSTNVDAYGAGLPNLVSRTGDWNRTLARSNTTERNAGLQLTVNGKFMTGRFGHQFTGGADYLRIVSLTNAFRISSNGQTVTVYDKINLLDPARYLQRSDIPLAERTTLTTAPSGRAGVFGQDLITLTEKVKIFTGLRWSYQVRPRTNILNVPAGTSTQGTAASAFFSAFSPKLALLFQPAKTNTIFAAYSSNFSINTGTDIYGQALKPSIVDQYELGVKNSMFNNRLTANLSLYRIRNSNLAQQAEFRADGSINNDATVRELKGETTSDGMEADLQYVHPGGFYVIAGYGYNYMRFTHTPGTKGSNIAGERLVNNPAHTVNFTGFYTFSNRSLKGLKLGISCFYTGKRFGGYNNTVGQSLSGSRLLALNGFATAEISAGYVKDKYSVLCKVSNLFDARAFLVHDNYSIAPLAPRQFSVTAACKWNKRKGHVSRS